MTYFIIFGSIAVYLAMWIITWRDAQRRYLEHLIDYNRRHYPSLYGSSGAYSLQRGYVSSDLAVARCVGLYVGLLWPVYWVILGIAGLAVMLIRTFGGSLEVVPRQVREQRDAAKARQMQATIDAQHADIARLERELGLPHVELPAPVRPRPQ